jgi:chromosome segregation ATPase
MGSGDITKEYDKLERILIELGELRAVVNGSANDIASVKTELASVKTSLASVDARLTSVESRLDSLEDKFAKKLGSLETRLDSLEDKFAKKLQETKPIWVAELNDKIDTLSAKVDQTNREVRDLSYAVSTITTDVASLRARNADLEHRFNVFEREQRERV